MAYATSSVESGSRNRISKHPPNSRVEQVRYYRNPDTNYRYNLGANNNSNKTLLDYSGIDDNLNYDTLDSAYSTSESSYNTVDSSYTQRSNSSGYNTLELKWKEPKAKHGVERLKQVPSNRNSVFNHVSGSFEGELSEGSFKEAELDGIKFADDLDDSDTATETETDTEFTISGCSIDMSYVPDYVRPVMAPVSIATLTSTTSSFTMSRPIITSTMTSPSVSFTSSTVTSPIGSIQGENTTKSPKATSGYRRSDRNKSYAGYREDYVRKQKEKLCGRKSLDERLKSLELGASVQLQVCKGSQNRRRKSSEHDMVLTSKPQNENFSNVTSRSRSLSPSHILENDDNLMEKEMQIEPTPSRPPPPDIIESHQPPGGVTQDSSENFETSQHNDGVPLRLTQPLDDVQAMQSEVFFESATTDLQVDLDSPKAERKHHPVAIKWKVATPPISRKTSYDLEAERDLQRNSAKLSLDKSNANNYDIINDITPTSVEVVNADPLSQNEKETSSPPTVNTPVSLVCLPDGKDVSEITKNVTRRDGPLQRRGAPAPLILDVATDNAVVPVELRSPRAEGGGFGRAVMREKRNARVFTLPSSDDSESDNLLSKINKPVENRSVHIAPVKFVPSVLRRSRSRSAAKEDVSHSSSTSSIATDNKTTNADETKQQISSAPKESRRKSSRSPKRSSSKRSNRSKSTHDRPSTDRPTGDQGKSSRRLSSGSHSPVSVANSNSDRLSRQPSEQRSQRSNQRSKEKSSRSPHTRHKTEYNELTNVKRSHRKVMEASSLPSPRQQAVAHAVKFGFSRNEGAIPYIDEATSPEENKKFKVDEMRRRAASDGALLHEADSATIRRALPLSRRGRSSSRKEGPRRTSYMEAMESSDDLTPDPDTDGSIYSIVRTDSGKESRIAVSKFGRSTSADSILSITDVPTKVVLRKNTRSSSADRNSLKGVHRRSYQIATKPTNDALLRTPPHKRQPSIRKLKNFFGENTPQIVEAQADESRRGSRGRSLAPPPTLDLNEYDDSVVREGFLYFKVATIEKGKRTSSQKSWKLIWVVLKEQSLYLCKDWTRNKPDAPLVAPGATPGSNPGPPIGAGQPPSQLTLEEEEPLNIQGSLVSIAYNYVKRRNVFKVTTCNGSEYLLQADDRDDMLTWITSIQVSGNHDNAGGEATINEDLILRKTSQIESGVRPLEDSSTPAGKSTLPRSQSDPTRFHVTTRNRTSSDIDPSSHPRLGPPPFYGNYANTVPQHRHPKPIVKVKPSSPRALQKSHITSAAISSPQPLDLHGIPNGLVEIAPSEQHTSPVIRRTKAESPYKPGEEKRSRRKGIVWSETTSRQPLTISEPIAIPRAHSTENLENIDVQPRSIEEQEFLLRELAESQNISYSPPHSEEEEEVAPEKDEKPKKSKKPKPRAVEQLRDSSPRPRSATPGGRMADKIQRTIRALYDGNSGRKSSFEKLDTCTEEGSGSDSLKLKPAPLNSKYDNTSPKPDKKTTRKSRSPKPVRRITVPIKDIDGSRRFKWRGSVNRIVRKFGQGQTLMQGGTFDVHLEDCPPSPNNECIPFVVELCCRIVEERGLSFTGIYRVPGNSGTLVALQEELNIRGPEAVDLENDERFCELNVVSSLLKSFFRKLPDPLFTNELYDDFISMNRKKESEERLNGLRRLIHMLPAPHYETLKFLITHLRRVADNCDVNKMEVRNLAIVFGPTLVRSTISDNMATMVTDMSDQCRIVESVLQHTPWFFNDDEIPGAEVKPAPVPSEVQHEPVPNIDHLLANVGRTPGDVSDSTSDSSKSKTSVASEKESFSRDVMEMIFGAGKRWLQNQQETNKMKEKEEEDSSDDEFGFKQAERNLARATEQRMKTPPKSPASTTSSTKYQVAKPAASGIRAGWPSKGQHLPHDIPARLYDFYVENLERLARTDVTRPLPNFSSSSTDTSPQVTPRSSLFGPPQPQRSYPMQVRRSSDLRLQNGAPEHPDNTSRQYNVPPSSPPQKPRIYGVSPQNQRYCKKPSEFQSVLATSTPLRMNDDRRLQPTRGQNESELSTISKEGCHGDEDSDSDTSIYVGDTLEEKLKNLTNLDKKLERRPSRRYANRPPQDVMVKVPPAPSKPVVKKLTAPSRKAGELITPDNVHMFPAKKTSKELYQERKAQRMQHRVLVKATRGNRKETNLARCASDENVFNRCDPKRQMIRSGAHDDVTNHRARPSQERVRRRHTLGGNDFPGQEFWDKSVYASLQNITQDAPAGSAMARLRPKLGASDPSVTLQPQTARLLGYVGSWRTDKGRKTESYL